MDYKKDRLEKALEIKKYENIESTSKSPKNIGFSKIAKKPMFFGVSAIVLRCWGYNRTRNAPDDSRHLLG